MGSDDYPPAVTESRYGIPLGFYTDCDTAVCRDCAPDAWMSGDYTGWPGFEGWESPAAILMDDASDTVTHCGECGAVIAHDLTPDGCQMITEALGEYLSDPRQHPALPQWMDAYGGTSLGGGGHLVDLPEEYLSGFTAGYAHAMLWANTRIDTGDQDEDASPDVDPAWWQTPAGGWQLQAFDSESQESITEDCAAFVRDNWRDLGVAAGHGRDAGDCGHDFALTRNHHGAGFWARGLGDAGGRLTDAAHAYGESTAWVASEDVSDGDALAHLG